MARERGADDDAKTFGKSRSNGVKNGIGMHGDVERVGPLEENAGALEVVLTAEDLSRIDAAFPAGAARGERYPEQAMRALNR